MRHYKLYNHFKIYFFISFLTSQELSAKSIIIAIEIQKIQKLVLNNFSSKQSDNSVRIRISIFLIKSRNHNELNTKSNI